MRTVTRTIHIAELAEVNPTIDAPRFEAMLRDTDPGGRADHTDKKPATASWYHGRSDDGYCTTVFHSYRRPGWEAGSPGCYEHPTKSSGERIAVGSYNGERGEWRLNKRGDGHKAPYEV